MIGACIGVGLAVALVIAACLHSAIYGKGHLAYRGMLDFVSRTTENVSNRQAGRG